MKILKARNGIALVAVLTIMLISSLFIPLMFNLSDTSLYTAVKGTDRQRASYLARTVTEMSVAAFKKFDSISIEDLTTTQLQLKNGIDALINGTDDDGKIPIVPVAMFKTYVDGYRYYKIVNGNEKEISETDYNVLLQTLADLERAGQTATFELRMESSVTYYKVENGVKTKITKSIYDGLKAEPVQGVELTTESDPIEKICYTPKSGAGSEYENWMESSDYTYLGEAQCEMTYEGGTTYYKKWLAAKDGHEAGEVEKLSKDQYLADVQTYMAAVKNKTLDTLGWEVSSSNNKNIKFTTIAEVNGIKATRSCVLVLPTYPTEDEWFTLSTAENTGGNQVFVDPNKATSRVPINYDRGGNAKYQEQSLLVYSSVGNMVIGYGTVKGREDSITYQKGTNGADFVLGIEPGINTDEPEDDPNCAILAGVNYDGRLESTQSNNFVAFTSTKAIKVELPINLLVNPCRSGTIIPPLHWGDGETPNASLYKIMMFQAPDIIFDGKVEMMMSFFFRGDEDARRMSSVVLNAPSNTPYSYIHEDYGPVKAGRVFFTEDCYLYIIPYGEVGSHIDTQTVYYLDESVGDIQRHKIASAGDVYYFNAEVMQTKDIVDAAGEPTGDTVTNLVGFSLTGYYLETEYFENYADENKDEWWKVWNNTQAAIFGSYVKTNFTGQNATYKKDDFHYIGNIKDGISLIEYPEPEDYYVIWEN